MICQDECEGYDQVDVQTIGGPDENCEVVYACLLGGWKSHRPDHVRTRSTKQALSWPVHTACLVGTNEMPVPHGDLLSEHIDVVICVGFECAIADPQINRCEVTGHASFVDLRMCQPIVPIACSCLMILYHFRRFRASDVELEVCIFLPVSIEQRESREKAVVNLACRCDCAGAGIAIDATLLLFRRADQFFPVFVVVGVLELWLCEC